MGTPPSFDHKAYTRAVEKNWSRAAPFFERISSDYFAPATAPYFPFAGLKPGQNILDVACGPGTSTCLAAECVLPSGRALGVDISPNMLKIASAKFPALQFEPMNAEALFFPDDSFDAVLCHLGLMLFARPQVALAEMVRVLKPGGTLSCLVLGAPRRMVFTNLLLSILPRYAPELKNGGAPGLADFAEPAGLEKAFAAAGLRATASKRLHGTFRVASADAYWDIVVKGFGRLGPILKGLARKDSEAIKLELAAKLSAYKKGDHLDIPYEFVMARGRKPE
jgi:ubiquinone/menaquinone biosynthesis C-methylase UbiE